MAIGLAAPVPAMSGAEPCTGSYKDFRLPFASAAPRDADGKHAQRARQHRRDIRQHVAEQIVRNDHIKLFRPPHKLHAAGVRQHVAQLNIGIILRMGF